MNTHCGTCTCTPTIRVLWCWGCGRRLVDRVEYERLEREHGVKPSPIFYEGICQDCPVVDRMLAGKSS